MWEIWQTRSTNESLYLRSAEKECENVFPLQLIFDMKPRRLSTVSLYCIWTKSRGIKLKLKKEEHALSHPHVYLEPGFLSWESPFLPYEKFLSHTGESSLNTVFVMWLCKT